MILKHIVLVFKHIVLEHFYHKSKDNNILIILMKFKRNFKYIFTKPLNCISSTKISST